MPSVIIIICVEILQVKQEEMSIIQKEKDVLYKELKESRYEVASLSEQRDAYRQSHDKHQSHADREISKLHSRLKGKIFSSVNYKLVLKVRSLPQ